MEKIIRKVLQGQRGLCLNHRGNGKVQVVSRDSNVAKGEIVEASLIKEAENYSLFSCRRTNGAIILSYWDDGRVGSELFVDGKKVCELSREFKEEGKLLDQYSWWGGRSNNSWYFYEVPKELVEDLVLQSKVKKIFDENRVYDCIVNGYRPPELALIVPLITYMSGYQCLLEAEGIKNLCGEIKNIPHKEVNLMLLLEAATRLLAQ